MTIGRIYIATSKGFPGRVKIGVTLRASKVRVAELQRHYGTRHKFTEMFSLLVHNPFAVEALVHRALDGYRDRGTEMFLCTPERAKQAILWAADEALRHPIVPRPKRAPYRWRRARHLLTFELWLILLAGTLIGLINYFQPAMPDWLPAAVQRTILRLESH